MGKKSLTKSTTKKKTAPAKKSTTEKKKVNASAPKSDVQPKKTTQSVSKKSAAVQKPTIESLLKINFGDWSPKISFSVQPDESFLKNFTAPPAIDETNKAEAQRIKALLSRKFDLTITAEPEKPAVKDKIEIEPPRAEAKAEKPSVLVPPEKPKGKKAASIPELLKMTFDAWQPETILAGVSNEKYHQGFSAPEFIEGSDPENTNRLKSLLLKTIDLTAVDVQEAPAPEICAAKIEFKPAEPEKVPAAQKIPEETPKAEEAPLKETAPPKKEEIHAPPATKAPDKPTLAPVTKTADIQKEKPKTPAPVSPALQPAPQKVDIPIPAPDAAVKQPETFSTGLKVLVGCIAAMFAMLFLASFINTDNYYLKQSGAALEIWRGKFSPTGKKFMMTIPDVKLAEPAKPVYTRAEALIPVFNYYLRQADEMSEAKGTIDFEAIKTNLKKAIEFAPTHKERQLAEYRMTSMDFMFLMFKANAAARNKSPKDIEKALNFLNEARSLDLDKAQQELLEKKISKLQVVKDAAGKPAPQPAGSPASTK